MTPETWQRIKQISGDAWDMPAGARPAFLAEACAGDAELLREVASLLESTDAKHPATDALLPGGGHADAAYNRTPTEHWVDGGMSA